ncbi:MAG: TonB-dependent receptor [Halioglobus sp.]
MAQLTTVHTKTPLATKKTLAAAVAAGMFALSSMQAQAVLEEVIVTAQKKEESLQTVAIAVSAFSAETFNNAGMLKVEDLTRLTPGFSISVYNPVSPQPYIRGIGSNPSDAGSDASIGIFVDEVYAGRAGGYSADMFDIERVEVLRGPQGTLYGRNVPGGAINVISKRPTQELEGFIELTGGDYDLRAAKGAISGPFSDSVAGRLAFSTRKRDGHIENVVTGNDLGDEDNVSFRGRLDFDLSETFSLQLIAENSEDDLLGPAARNYEGISSTLLLEGLGVGFLAPVEPPTSPAIDTVELAVDGFAEREMEGYSMKMDWELGAMTLTSITGYRKSDYAFEDDLLGIAIPLFLNSAEESSDQISQEFRLSSSSERLEWTAGLYYLEEDVERLEFWDISYLDPIFGLDLIGQTAAVGYDQENKTTSYAVFGQLTYSFTDRLDLTLGGRYSQDKKDFSLTTSGTEIGFVLLTPDPETGVASPFSASDDETWSNFTPKIALEFAASDALFFYGSYARGFKSGGYNGLATDSGKASTPFDEEQADSYELGMKSDFMDNRVRLNAALYYTDYADMQVFFTNPGGLGLNIDNAAEATIQGIELELFLSPIDGLDISATYAYLDTEVDEFDDKPEVVGNQLARSPEHTASLSAQYILSVSDGLDILMRADYSYQDSMFFNIENSSISAADDYDLVNVRLALQGAQGWELALWGRNISDEEYRVHGFDSSFGDNLAVSPLYGTPKMWGLSASYAF